MEYTSAVNGLNCSTISSSSTKGVAFDGDQKADFASDFRLYLSVAAGDGEFRICKHLCVGFGSEFHDPISSVRIREADHLVRADDLRNLCFEFFRSEFLVLSVEVFFRVHVDVEVDNALLTLGFVSHGFRVRSHGSSKIKKNSKKKLLRKKKKKVRKTSSKVCTLLKEQPMSNGLSVVMKLSRYLKSLYAS